MSKPLVGKRLVGVVIPVGALRSKDGMGAGEFSDLPAFALLCKKMKLGLIQLLPVNDTGFDSSPYFSLTAFALHPLYLRIDELDEFKKADSSIKKRMKEAKEKFDKDTRFSHYNILKEKLEICRELFDICKAEIIKSASSGRLAGWIKQNSWVKEYAVYRRLKEINDLKSWKEWTEHRDVTMAQVVGFWNDKKLQEDHLFWVWLQEALDIQFSKAAKAVADTGIILKGDIPILMNDDSCDVWAHPEIFIQDLSAGAPPDMYSPEGQNWGFPIYNWETQEKDNFAWWRSRLSVAEKYFGAYRIDHVLGFFRIWSTSKSEISSTLGRFVPYVPVTAGDLKKLGFDKSRIRWVSQPHIATGEVWDTLRRDGSFSEEEIAAAAEKVFSAALKRVNDEELWLFNSKISGEKDINKLDVPSVIKKFLVKEWHNRIFLEYEKGNFSPVWYYKNSRAYNSLSADEKKDLDTLLVNCQKKSEKIWEQQGMNLLSVLAGSSGMLPCAEDLGAVPACVPKVLSKLEILCLRVVRWFRVWEKEGQPFIPFEEYPELGVCTPSVHDSSTVREWWEKEVNQEQFSGFIGVPSLPVKYNPGTAKIVLSKTVSARSCFRVFQIQDLLHLSNKWYSEDPAQERINVPGTYNDFNWTYRLPAAIDEISKDTDLIAAVAELSKIKKAVKKPAGK